MYGEKADACKTASPGLMAAQQEIRKREKKEGRVLLGLLMPGFNARILTVNAAPSDHSSGQAVSPQGSVSHRALMCVPLLGFRDGNTFQMLLVRGASTSLVCHRPQPHTSLTSTFIKFSSQFHQCVFCLSLAGPLADAVIGSRNRPSGWNSSIDSTHIIL